MLGNTISRFSRKYFFSAAIVAMAIVSSYYWSGFPYDNLCSEYTAARAVVILKCVFAMILTLSPMLLSTILPLLRQRGRAA
jgi:hypothetical protein